MSQNMIIGSICILAGVLSILSVTVFKSITWKFTQFGLWFRGAKSAEPNILFYIRGIVGGIVGIIAGIVIIFFVKPQ
jgi:hypothetical protein